MNAKDDGGLAFPGSRFEPNPEAERFGNPTVSVSYPGMTLRDWFAGQALAGLLARGKPMRGREKGFAFQSYYLADALIVERSK